MTIIRRFGPQPTDLPESLPGDPLGGVDCPPCNQKYTWRPAADPERLKRFWDRHREHIDQWTRPEEQR